MRRTISRKMQKGRVGAARRLTNLKAVERIGRCNSRDRSVIDCFLREACKQTQVISNNQMQIVVLMAMINRTTKRIRQMRSNFGNCGKDSDKMDKLRV